MPPNNNRIDIERERFAQKYGSAPAGKDLVGMKSGKPVYGDASQTAGYKTPSAEEISSTFQELENTKEYSPKPEGDLDKRKELASVLKQFARGEVKVNPEDMVKAGATMGVSRNQLSNLYQQYRKDFQANPPESATSMAASTPPAGTPAPMGATAMQGTPMGSVSIGAKGVQGATGGLAKGPSQTGDSGPFGNPAYRVVPLGGSLFGSRSSAERQMNAITTAEGVQGATGGLAKGPSRTGGTPIGRGVPLGGSPFGSRSSAARQMNAITGANLFFAAEERRRQLEEQAAREKGFNMAYGNQRPFYQAATYNIR